MDRPRPARVISIGQFSAARFYFPALMALYLCNHLSIGNAFLPRVDAAARFELVRSITTEWPWLSYYCEQTVVTFRGLFARPYNFGFHIHSSTVALTVGGKMHVIVTPREYAVDAGTRGESIRGYSDSEFFIDFRRIVPV